MYEFEFEGYSKEQCEKYLERIGAEYDGNPTLENLDNLIHRHQIEVPFENLNLKMNLGPINLDPDALFEKIVTNRRGGFCFELNGSFLLLLKGLGYDAVGVMARVGIPFIGKLFDLSHRGIVVRIDGKKRYCDVGFGGPKADWAIEITDEKQTKNGHTCWIEDTYEGWKMVKNESSDADGSVIIFAPIAMLPTDFIANCDRLVNSGVSMFHQVRLVNRNLENGYIDLKDNHFKMCVDGVVEERDFDESEFAGIVEKYFGLKLN